MRKPMIVVMAAGMGSRFGGLKQLEPIGQQGEVILDYSIYDAKRAGFETVVFVINHRIEKEFKEKVGDRLSKVMNVRYAYQEVDQVPKGIEVPQGRVKPWGTAHCVVVSKEVIDQPFAIINADDFYGKEAFKVMFDYLSSLQEDGSYAMVGYPLKNTVSEFGSVSRGLCQVDGYNQLVDIVEKTEIYKRDNRIEYNENGQFVSVDPNTYVSMNFWGFHEGFVNRVEKHFEKEIVEVLKKNPEKGEVYLPSVVKEQIKNHEVSVTVLKCDSQWYGITYQEDKSFVVESLNKLIKNGDYENPLWRKQS
ncbi:MAG: NTP transferase domain-containing protein [Erysipelothrix sp.]|nr:NTP transferase domain-containing protein [Erysipelothrix sp.]